MRADSALQQIAGEKCGLKAKVFPLFGKKISLFKLNEKQ